MIKLELASDEQRMLSQILTSYLSDLRFEISDTDRKRFRDNWQEHEVLLNKILNALGVNQSENLLNE